MNPPTVFNATSYHRCYAVMDPYAALPTRCSLPRGHEGPHKSMHTSTLGEALYEWENDDEAD